jgi:hypothetical protein
MQPGRCRVAATLLALAVLSAGCAAQQGRPARSTLGCARAAVEQLPAGLTDPEKHCLASALITRQCSRFEAWLAGWGKEAGDAVGGGDASLDDLRSNRLGRACAGRTSGTDSLLGCCRESLAASTD